ncbi:ClbS/DfsB family four-helix bundle protein [Aquimarina sp. U1-2]|uniref:ClbS/DfsB family four-helix bundle protein n=1 Tax=Aquimarina sp. U1-2 TaxID=2823141 RepID=UPI001AECB76D|nr:ClbS/DfsB family four-helix bundle protein [Aquimarina sp. U1-2]MBP2831473.1 ClbS/DfsB family four-helix bundle protein [Aquimarina sp. U1-2]
MPRPKTKEELIHLSHKNYTKLINYIDSFSTKELSTPFPDGYLNRNVKDVLAHLHHWHIMTLGWYAVGMKGGKPDMPAKGYNWKMTPALNREIWKKYENISLEEAVQLLEESFSRIQQVITKHSDNELFEKKKYTWTGSTSLGSYLISATSSHYDWAYKLIKRCRKEMKKAS